MHRSYQPIQPTHNKLLQKRWDRTYYNEHINRLKSVKSMVDTKAPQTYVHMHLKLKKLQLEEERMSTIERDNRLLLEKMSQIIRTRGRVDNRNYYSYKSLNHEKRQRELARVTRENQKILQKITGKEAEYSHQKLEADWKKHEQMMDNIARYPKNWWKLVEKQRKYKMENRSQSGVTLKQKTTLLSSASKPRAVSTHFSDRSSISKKAGSLMSSKASSVQSATSTSSLNVIIKTKTCETDNLISKPSSLVIKNTNSISTTQSENCVAESVVSEFSSTEVVSDKKDSEKVSLDNEHASLNSKSEKKELIDSMKYSTECFIENGDKEKEQVVDCKSVTEN